MHVKFHLAEVISNNNIDTYKRTEIDNSINDFFLITVRTYDANRTQDIDCRPANPNIKQIPLIGEHVLIFQGTNEFSNIDKFRRQWYYLPAYSIQSAINENALPGVAKLRASDINPLPSQDNTPLGNSFKQKVVSPLQPYEGDILIEGRFSNSIRLGSTVTGGDYTISPSWRGNTNSDPIIILSNGHTDLRNKKFTIEDINKDASSLYLTSKQKVSTLKLYKPLTKSTNYTSYDMPQLIGSANRIVFAAKTDSIILDTPNRITLNTPEVCLGSEDKNHPLVKGDILKDILQQLILVINAGVTGPAGILSLPNNQPQLLEIQEKLAQLNSNNHYMDK